MLGKDALFLSDGCASSAAECLPLSTKLELEATFSDIILYSYSTVETRKPGRATTVLPVAILIPEKN